MERKSGRGGLPHRKRLIVCCSVSPNIFSLSHTNVRVPPRHILFAVLLPDCPPLLSTLRFKQFVFCSFERRDRWTGEGGREYSTSTKYQGPCDQQVLDWTILECDCEAEAGSVCVCVCLPSPLCHNEIKLEDAQRVLCTCDLRQAKATSACVLRISAFLSRTQPTI